MSSNNYQDFYAEGGYGDSGTTGSETSGTSKTDDTDQEFGGVSGGDYSQVEDTDESQSTDSSDAQDATDGPAFDAPDRGSGPSGEQDYSGVRDDSFEDDSQEVGGTEQQAAGGATPTEEDLQSPSGVSMDDGPIDRQGSTTGVETESGEVGRQARELETRFLRQSEQFGQRDQVTVTREDGTLRATPTEQARRERQRTQEQLARLSLASQIQERTGEPVDPNRDFALQRRQEEDQVVYSAELTPFARRDVGLDSRLDAPRVNPDARSVSEVRRSEVSGEVATGEYIVNLTDQVERSGDSRVAASFIEGTFGVDVPTETEITEGFEDVTGIPGEEIRRGREDLAEGVTSGAEGVADFITASPEERGQMAGLSETEAEEVTNVRGSAPPVSGAIGPGGAVRGTGRVLASSDDILRGGVVVGTAAAASVGVNELDVPEQSREERTELSVPEQTRDQRSELGTPEGTRGTEEVAVPTSGLFNQELTPGEAVVSSELSIGEQGESQTPTQDSTQDSVVPGEFPTAGDNFPADPSQEYVSGERPEAIAGTSPVVEGELRQEEEAEQEDELGVPENEPFRESDRRLYDPSREFGEPEGVGQSVDPTGEGLEPGEDIGSGIAGISGGYQPARGQTVEENFARYMEERREMQEQAERSEVLYRDDVVGRGTLAGLVGEGVTSNTLDATQEPTQVLREQAQEREATRTDGDVRIRPDDMLSPFEDSQQDEDVAEDQQARQDQPFDDLFEQTPATDEATDETTVNESTTRQITESVTTNATTTGQGYAYPPGYGTPTPPSYGYPGTPGTPPTRAPPDLSLPEIPDVDDDEQEQDAGVGVAAEILTDFANPLTGETLRTERDPTDQGQIPGFDL